MTISQIFGVFCQEWLESVLSVSCPLELSDSKNPKTLKATNPAPTHRPRMKFRDEVKWSNQARLGWKRMKEVHCRTSSKSCSKDCLNEFYWILSYIISSCCVYSVTCCIIPWDPEGGWTKAVSKGTPPHRRPDTSVKVKMPAVKIGENSAGL